MGPLVVEPVRAVLVAMAAAGAEAQDAEALRLVLVEVGLRRASKRALPALRARAQVVAEPLEAVAVAVAPHAEYGVALVAPLAVPATRVRAPLRPKSAVASVLRQRVWVRT